MSSSTKTPNMNLSQFAPTDKPTFNGDYNTDMENIDTYTGGIKARVDHLTTGVYNVLDYGAVADSGTTDNTAHIQAAIDACVAGGGGNVIAQPLPGFKFGWAGQVIVKNGVTLEGNCAANDDSLTTLLATSATSQILVGDFTNSPIENYSGGLKNVAIDGNNEGPTGATVRGLVNVQSVHFDIENLYVKNGAGDNVVFDAAQNGVIKQLVTEGAADTGLVLTNGAGGLTFIGGHSASNKLEQVKFDDDAGANAYTWGPEQNQFFGFIFETNQATGTNIGNFQCGLLNDFYNCLFSANNAVALSDNCVIRCTPDFIGSGVGMSVHFHNCQFVGGTNKYDIVRANGGCEVDMDGITSIAYTTNLMVADTGAPVFNLKGKVAYGASAPNSTATHMFNTVNGGALTNCGDEQNSMVNWYTDSNWPYVFAGRRRGDVGQRFLMNQDGALAWGNGTGTVGTANISGDTVTNTVLVSGHRNAGIDIQDLYIQTTISAASAVTVNAANGSKQELFISATGSITSMTITNPVANQKLTIKIAQTGGRAYVWPANCRFAGGVAPNDTTANCFCSVTFFYDSQVSLWIEEGRSVAVPYV